MKGTNIIVKTIRVGSRDSKLAVVQSNIVIEAIQAQCPELKVELVTMKTTGDIILDRTLDKIGGKGLFVKELDAALLEGRVDITVHSSKDLPMELHAELPIVAVSGREDPCDALVLPEGTELFKDGGAPIGCSSLRRTIQLKALYPGAEVTPVRGNVQTRLRKLDSGEYSALVLAAAGLNRLGLQNRIHRIFTPQEMIPAAGQGILAIQARAGEDTSFLRAFNNTDAADCLLAERAFVRALDGGCSSPVAAYAVITGDVIHITGLDVDNSGATIIESISGSRNDAESLGTELAAKIRRNIK